MNTQPLTLIERYFPLLMVCNIAFGVFQCFFGLRYWKTILAFGGFIMGFGSCAGALLILGKPIDVALLSGLVAGATGAFLFYTLPRLGTFVAAAGVFGGVTFLVAQMLIPKEKLAANDAVITVLVLAAIAAVVGAIATLVSKERGIITLSSLSGAWSIVGGLSYFLASGGLTFAESPLIQLLSIAGLSFFGARHQARQPSENMRIPPKDVATPSLPPERAITS